MAAHRLRPSAFAAALTALWLTAQPPAVFAQAPVTEVPTRSADLASPGAFALPDNPLTTYTVVEESPRGRFARFFTEGEWYASLGLSRDFWSATDIRVLQPSLGNSFTIYDVRGKDSPGYDSLFGAQYNIRLGRFIDDARTLAVELNFDHTRYEVRGGQSARVAGTIAGSPVDGQFPLGTDFFSYRLANGANHAMVNIVKRRPLWGQPDEPFSVSAIGKVGAGLMLPHSENRVLGRDNDIGEKKFGQLFGFHRGWWQFDGFTAGVEGGFRIGLSRHLFFEVTDKVTYVHLTDIPVYQGTARHSLWMNEVVFSLGFTFGKY